MKKLSVLALFLAVIMLCSCGKKENKVVEATEEEIEETTEFTADFENVDFGSTIELDFVEMTIDKAETSKELTPGGDYVSYYESDDGETYLYLTGTLKNISDEEYSIHSTYVEFTFDGKDTYEGALLGSYDGSFELYVPSQETYGYKIYAEVPDEIINSYSTCEIKFAFTDDFQLGGHGAFEFNDHFYSITLTK